MKYFTIDRGSILGRSANVIRHYRILQFPYLIYFLVSDCTYVSSRLQFAPGSVDIRGVANISSFSYMKFEIVLLGTANYFTADYIILFLVFFYQTALDCFGKSLHYISGIPIVAFTFVQFICSLIDFISFRTENLFFKSFNHSFISLNILSFCIIFVAY